MNIYLYRIFVFAALLGVFLPSFTEAQKPNKNPKKTEITPAVKSQPKIESKTEPKTQSQNSKSPLSELDVAVIEEINLARGNPQKFVAYLEEYKKALKGNVLYLPNRPGITMIEGAAAIDDAINELKKLSKFDALSTSNGLFRTANIQLTDLQEDSTLSHRGKDGSDLEKRLLKFGFAGLNTAENICYKESVAREVVMTMILDDGLKNRPHRKNIFSRKFKQVGVSCGLNKKNEAICVAVFADSFKENTFTVSSKTKEF